MNPSNTTRKPKKWKQNKRSTSNTIKKNSDDIKNDSDNKECKDLHGLKAPLRGISFQMNLLILVLLRATRMNYYTFRMATELKEAEKFDDVVFQYKENEKDKWNCCLLQAKHKENNILAKIQMTQLLSLNDKNNYSLLKYFKSFVAIKKRSVRNSSDPLFGDSTIKDIIICTTVDLNQSIKNYCDMIELDSDDLLKLNDNLKEKYPNSAIYKFNNDIKSKLEFIFQVTSEFYELVEELADCILTDTQGINKTGLFEHYHNPLITKVFDIFQEENKLEYYAKFSEKFLDGDMKTKNFRDALIKEIIFREKYQSKEFDMTTQLEKTNWPNNAEKIEDFAKNLAANIKNIIQLPKHYFDLLPLVIKDNKFIDEFFQSKPIKKYPLKIFKRILIEKLIDNGEKCAEDLNAVKIKITNNFAATIQLPLEFTEHITDQNNSIFDYNSYVDEFFQTMKFVVFPKQDDIDKLIENELKITEKSLDVAFFKSQFHEKIFKWMTGNGWHLLTKEKSYFIFRDITKHITVSKMLGVTESYIEKYKSKVYKFNEYTELRDFLLNKEAQILHLIFSDISIGRSRIVQTYENLMKNIQMDNESSEIKKYILKSGAIFINAGESNEAVLECFQDNEVANLLVLDCNNKTEINDFDRFFIYLKNKNKKIILITQKDFDITEELKIFAKTNKYLNKIVETNFSDLSDESQQKLLNKDITFQGEKIILTNLLAENAKLFINPAVLRELIRKEEIVIDCDPVLNLSEIRNYFIDRPYDLEIQKILKQNDIYDRNLNNIYILNSSNDYPSNGISLGKYEIILTLKLFVIFAKYGLDQNSYFELGTLVSDYNLDRRMIMYKYLDNNNQNQYILMTACVYSTRVNSLTIYKLYEAFMDYLSVKKRIADGILKTFIYEDNVDKEWLKEVENNDDTSTGNIFSSYTKSFRINSNKYLEINNIFAKMCEINRLAQILIQSVLHEPTDEDRNLLQRYQLPLQNEIIDISIKKFKINFIDNFELSQEVSKFRYVIFRAFINNFISSFEQQDSFWKIFGLKYEEFLIKNPSYSITFLNTAENDQIHTCFIWELLKSVTFKIDNFQTLFNVGPQIDDVDSIVNNLLNILNSKKGQKHFIISEKDFTDFNLHKLFGYVLIPVSKSRLKFSLLFSGFCILPDNLNTFRAKLWNKSTALFLSELHQYSFETSSDKITSSIYHDGEIQDFLKKLIVVPQLRRQLDLFKNKNFTQQSHLLLDLIFNWIPKSIDYYICSDYIRNHINEYIREDCSVKYNHKKNQMNEHITYFIKNPHEYKFVYVITLVMLYLNEVKKQEFSNYCLNVLHYIHYGINLCDGLMFKYTDRKGETTFMAINFLLKNDVTEKINAYELLESNTIKRLFAYFRKAKPKVENKFIIYTNSSFDFDDFEKAKLKLRRIDEGEMLYTTEGVNCTQMPSSYKLTTYHLLYDHLKPKTDIYKQAKCLINSIFAKPTLNLFRYTSEYQSILKSEFIQNKNLSTDFIHNNLLSEPIKKFRNYLLCVLRGFAAMRNYDKLYSAKFATGDFQELSTEEVSAIFNDDVEALRFLHRKIESMPLELPSDIENVKNVELYFAGFPYLEYYSSDYSFVGSNSANLNFLYDESSLHSLQYYVYGVHTFAMTNYILIRTISKIFKFSITFTEYDIFERNMCMNRRIKNELQNFGVSFNELSKCEILIVEKQNFGISKYSNDMITDFLKALVFTVDQPTIMELNNILKSKLNKNNFYQFERFVLHRKPFSYFIIDSTIEEYTKCLELLNSKFNERVVSHRIRDFTDEEICKQKPIQYILAKGQNSDDINQFFKSYPNYDIYYIKEEEHKFVWHSSQGSLTELRKILEKDTYQFKSNEIFDTIVIIAAEPGMGKSTILNYLSEEMKKLYSSMWVLKFDLVHCQEQLKKKNWKFEDIYEIVEFLTSVKDFKSVLEKCFLQFQLKHVGNIALFFDGLDEIETENQGKVITLMKNLKKFKVNRLWVTTRLHLKTKIEDELSIISYTVKPFEECDQIDFLTKFWKQYILRQKSENSEINESRIKQYIEKLRNWFKQSTKKEERDFLGIPLQSKMLADVFKESCVEFYENDKTEPKFPKSINLINLYEEFIEAKYAIYFEQKLENKINKDSLKKALKNDLKEKHRLLAFNLLFHEERSLLPILQIDADDKNELILVGIIQSLGGELNFVHRTFAEYFVAEQLAENIFMNQTLEFLRRQIWKEKNIVIRIFLDYKLTKSNQILTAFLSNDDITFQEEFALHTINERDSLGRTALHLAVLYNCEGITQYLLDNNADISINDNILQWTPMIYALHGNNWKIAKLILNKGGNPDDIMKCMNIVPDKNGLTVLHFAAEHTNNNVVKYFIVNQKMDINISDNQGLTPIFYAIKGNNIDVLKYLILMNANIHAVNKSNLKPLHYAKILGNKSIIQFLGNII